MKNSLVYIVVCLLVLLTVKVYAQQGTIKGKVELSGKATKGALVTLSPSGKTTHSTDAGEFLFKKVTYGKYDIIVEYLGAQVYAQSITLASEQQVVSIVLKEDTTSLTEVEILGKNKNTFGIDNLKAVDGFGIYEAKKSEVVVIKDITANTSTNNARQVFSKVTGLNIWESDGGGLQMGVGGRGLSPNRTSNFNTRQNGYDISADALGYPESYYTPPVEGLKRIEIVRGAASLQYGTQFGGMLNFEMNKGPKDKKIELTSRQTFGSWNYFGSFNAIGGTIAKKKLNYYAFYQRKQGNGWRPNSGYEANTAYASATYSFTPRFSVNVDYTYMDYLAQQPGGLTDAEFYKKPSQSVRARNWFKVKWNLMAVTAEYKFTENTKLNIRNFGLLASRQSVGILDRVNVSDLGGPRDLIDGRFQNIGNETRLIHHYTLGKTDETLLVGFRVYKGTTHNRQGMSESSGSDANFNYANPDNLEKSDYTFPNLNAAVFAEHIFFLSPKFSVTPGVRYEYIKTMSNGYYKQTVKDGAGNIIVDNRIDDQQENERSFLLGGLGLSYKAKEYMEFYGNISQNYRAINFSDIYISNPSSSVDKNIKDEKGYTADLGVRGSYKQLFRFELTGFYIHYDDRIGVRQVPGTAPTFQETRIRTNIANAQNIGVEAFGEFDFWRLFKPEVENKSFSIFGNMGYVKATYQSDDKTINGKQVELAPPLIFRTGASFRLKEFRLSYQYSYTSDQYSDATNAKKSPTAVIGIIPAYAVMDLSASYTWKYFSVMVSVNNLADARYFTRRAESYPGPGIIPSDARSFFVTLQVKL